MEDFSNIINWKNVLKNSEPFKNAKPFRFGFIEEFLNRDFYEKLFATYPKINDMWHVSIDPRKDQLCRYWGEVGPNEVVGEDDDSQYSPEWNEFKRYAQSEEFIQNFRKFSDIPVSKLKFFHFMAYKKGGFQLPHVHNVGPSTLILMVYFSKNWQKGDPGGTYISTELNESSIIFEPYNLDNSVAILHDSPNAYHGIRYITKDVQRLALQITLEGYSSEKGWTGGNPEVEKQKISQNLREL